MKRKQPLKRVRGLEPRMDQVLAWQRRCQENALASKRTARRRQQRQRAKRNDAAWRAEVLELYGSWCRACAAGQVVKRDCLPPALEADHLIPRAQGGPSDVRNALVLCREHHRAKTEHRLLVDRAWLTTEQADWLRDEGHVDWVDGGPVGRHCRLFAALEQQEGN